MRFTICVHADDKSKTLPKKAQIKAWVSHCLQHFLTQAEVHVDFVAVDTMRDLNLRFRHKDYATNVLSFIETIPLPGKKFFLGNIILCPAVIASEAEQQHKSFENHLAHLLVHGCLHLLGYDHEIKQDAFKMEQCEIKILAELGIQNPYE